VSSAIGCRRLSPSSTSSFLARCVRASILKTAMALPADVSKSSSSAPSTRALLT
jgi:hypothetical protein